MNEQSILNQLHDIQGLDHIDWWPLAPIWWILLIITIICIGLSIKFYMIRKKFHLSWKGQITRELSKMSIEINEAKNLKKCLVRLSEIIRIIAMQKYSRPKCASLIGNDWLLWLKQHDPNQFDWVTHGKILINDVYSDTDMTNVTHTMRHLITATIKLVK